MIEHMQHLGNCHGEWTLFLGSIPFIGIWIKNILVRRHMRKHHGAK